MLKELKFVQGAIAKKDFVPALTHFRISQGRVRGFNGQLAICSPIDLDFDIAPNAMQFIKAINASEETISLHVAKNGSLIVNSGNFRAQVKCVDPTAYPDILPDGKMIKLEKPILPALSFLEPFIAEDASRPWACGIFLKDEFAHATNNVIALQYWLGFEFPNEIIIPGSTVRELIRVKEEPSYLQVSNTKLTFHYENGSWIMSNLLEGTWPNIDALLNRHMNKPVQTLEEHFWPSVQQLEPFTDEMHRCYFLGNCISTGKDAELANATVEGSFPQGPILNAKHLLKLAPVANRFGFTSYPEPIPFFGEMARGIIAGIIR